MAPLFAMLVVWGLLALRWQGALALLFLGVWVLLPGLALSCLLLPAAGRLCRALAGFFLGAGLCFLLFYPGKLLGTMLPLQVLPPLLGLSWALRRLCKSRGKGLALGGLARSLSNSWPLLWIVAVGTLVSYWLTVRAFPTAEGITNVDYLWHMGNVHTLAASPDLTDLRVSVMTFRYHYFSDLLWACGAIVLGLAPFNCILRLPALVVPALCAGAVWLCVRAGTKRRWLCAAATAACLFLAPLYGIYNDVTYQWATNVNAVGFALPCGLLLVHLAVTLAGREGVAPRDALVVFLLSALLTGLKGPFALCVLACVYGGSIAARWLPGHRLPRRWWTVLLALAAGFLLVWALLLRGGLNGDYIKSWQPGYSVITAEVLAPLIVALGNGAFARIALLPLHLVIVLGVFALPLVAGLARFAACLVRRRPLPVGFLFPLSGAWGSLLAFYLFDLTGRSQFYFLYFAVPLAAVASVWEVERWLASGRLPKAFRGALAALACVMLLFATRHPMVEGGWHKYSATEVEAAHWLGQHYDGGLVACNRHGAFYLTSGLSGAAFWLEGDAYARNSGYTLEDLESHRALGDSLFHPGTENAAALCREMGVTWLVQYQSEADEALTGPLGAGFALCYEAPDVRVWRVAA